MIVNLLPAIMRRRDMSIRELSRRTGITYTTIRAVYHSERQSVKLDVLDAICRSLGVQPGEIYQVSTPGVPEAPSSAIPPEMPLVEERRQRSGIRRQHVGGGSDDWVTWE